MLTTNRDQNVFSRLLRTVKTQPGIDAFPDIPRLNLYCLCDAPAK